MAKLQKVTRRTTTLAAMLVPSIANHCLVSGGPDFYSNSATTSHKNMHMTMAME